MTSPGRFAVVALGICAASVLIVPGSASALQVKVGLPKEGATALVVSQLRYTGKPPDKTRVRIKAPSRLPASDRGLYAIYGRQRGRQAIVTVYTILLRQLPSKKSAPASALAGSSGDVQ